MGDKAATLNKAAMELEEMYLGVPDESVDLTFQDLADVKPQKKKVALTNNNNMELPISEKNTNAEENISPLRKIPSLDFSKGLQAANHHPHHHHPLERINEDDVVHRFSTHHHDHHRNKEFSHQNDHHGQHRVNPNSVAHSGFRHAVESSMVHGDGSMASVYVGRRRPGIPHSKICTVCSTYIYMFRHRCLVCGRVYCRQCVGIGMGEMTEGRKCIECLGRGFSQRYIHRAGEAGCFCSRYPSVVRHAELKWAEKGPRRSGQRGYRSGMVSARSRSPLSPRTPTGPDARSGPNSFGMVSASSRSPLSPRTPTGPDASSGPNSFVMSSSYSPYAPSHHHFPF